MLRDHLGDAAVNVPTTEIPDEVVRANAPASDPMAREVGNFRHLSAEKARRVLGWEPRSTEEAILATADSLLGLAIS